MKQELGARCMVQDSAVHNHSLLEHDHCNHPHADCMKTRGNHLDLLAYDFLLCLFLVHHHHHHREVVHNSATDTVGSRLEGLLEAELGVAVGSCTGLMPSLVVLQDLR
jgi:hypothetical protein